MRRREVKRVVVEFIRRGPSRGFADTVAALVAEWGETHDFEARDVRVALLDLIDEGRVWVRLDFSLYVVKEPMPYVGEG